MRYIRVNVLKYKAVHNSTLSVIDQPVPIIGVNESGKSSVFEGVARFDYRNDDIANQRHWQFINRYNPSEKEFSVSAEIEYEQADIDEILTKFSDPDKSIITGILPSTSNHKIEVIRKFYALNNQPPSYFLGDQNSDVIQKFCQEVIMKLPRILYFDNFLERQFPDSIDFGPQYVSDPNIVLDENQIIISNMFDDAKYPLKDFFGSSDVSTQETIISDVSRSATAKVIADWKKMHVNQQDLDTGAVSDILIKLSQNRKNPNAIDVQIIEEFTGIDRVKRRITMPLSERSLGFRWFFNFSVKKCFASKNKGQFIYLFDEPGSYLHNSGQIIMAQAIKDLANDHAVFFSTHSEFLLNPEIININNIRVVTKTDREITLVPLAQTKGKKNVGSLSALYNALRMNAQIGSVINQKVIVTEGITDFYFWKMLLNNIVFLPGFGAGQNEYLLSIAIGTSKKYLAFFDGDQSGNDAIVKYKRHFGDEESKHWKMYKNSGDVRIELEDILSDEDKARLTSITKASDLKKALTLLFFSENKDSFWTGINAKTKKNIKANFSIIKSSLNLQKKSYFKYKIE